MRAVTNFLAWLRGTKWIQNNLSGHDLTGGCLNPNDEDDHTFENDLKAMRDSFANDRMNKRKEIEVEAGNFVYYVVDEDTNDRKTLDDGTPIIYATQDAAEFACRGYDKVISIAAYNRLYGRVMSNESFAAKYP